KTQEMSLPTDLAYVPSDASGFVAMQVSKLRDSDIARRHLNSGDRAGVLHVLDPIPGIKPEEIERVILFPSRSRFDVVSVVRTAKPHDQTQVLRTLLPRSWEHKLVDTTYWRATNENLALHFVDDRVFLFGGETSLREVILARHVERDSQAGLRRSLSLVG